VLTGVSGKPGTGTLLAWRPEDGMISARLWHWVRARHGLHGITIDDFDDIRTVRAIGQLCCIGWGYEEQLKTIRAIITPTMCRRPIAWFRVLSPYSSFFGSFSRITWKQ
jgi:hypothetical protein